jgi:hypothetical protein
MQGDELQRAKGAASDGSEQQHQARITFQLGPVRPQMRQRERQNHDHDDDPAQHGQARRRNVPARCACDDVVAGPARGCQGQQDVGGGLRAEKRRHVRLSWWFAPAEAGTRNGRAAELHT